MQLDSYEKASLNIIEYLEKDGTILLINSIVFKSIISLSSGGSLKKFSALSWDHIDIFDYIPGVIVEIKLSLPYPDQELLLYNHFVTELVGQFDEVWIPVAAPAYQKTLVTSFSQDVEMNEWQRFIRASMSDCKTELTILSLDPSKIVRETAQYNLKMNN